MKKKLALLLAGAMVLSLLLSACSAQAGPESEPPQPAQSTDTPEPSVPATVPPEEPSPSEKAPESSAQEPSAAASQAAPAQESTPQPTQAPAGDTSKLTQAPAVNTPKPQPTQAPAVNTPKPQPTPAPVVNTPPPAVSTPAPAPEPTPTPVSVPEPTPTPAPAATRETAMAYIGQSLSSLTAAIGQPNGSDYAPSCLGSGEDGELFYNGFTVYTYREGGVETVKDVI